MGRRKNEFDPEAHEKMVRNIQPSRYSVLGKYALFDELVDESALGLMTREEALAKFRSTIESRDGQSAEAV